MNSFVSDPGSQFSKISNSLGEAGAIDETLLFVYLLKLSKLPLSAEILMLQCTFFYVVFQEKAKKKSTKSSELRQKVLHPAAG